MARKNLEEAILSVIIVTQNDEKYIKERISDLHGKLTRINLYFEILVVDNNSNDQTISVLQKLKKVMSHTRILILSKDYETEIALTAGIDNCVGDYAILFNLYSDPSEMINVFVEKMKEGYDIVIGKPKKNAYKRSFISNLFLNTIEKLSRHEFYYGQNYLMGLNRKAINSITRTRRKSRNLSYINYLIGFKKLVIEYKPLKQLSDKLNAENFFKLLISTLDIIISNSFRPIRILSFLGMTASGFFLIYALIITILVFAFNQRNLAPQGWISVAIVLSSLFFLLFSLLTLISEYIIRIINETRDEPIYFVSEEIDRTILLSKRKTLNIV